MGGRPLSVERSSTMESGEHGHQNGITVQDHNRYSDHCLTPQLPISLVRPASPLPTTYRQTSGPFTQRRSMGPDQVGRGRTPHAFSSSHAYGSPTTSPSTSRNVSPAASAASRAALPGPTTCLDSICVPSPRSSPIFSSVPREQQSVHGRPPSTQRRAASPVGSSSFPICTPSSMVSHRTSIRESEMPIKSDAGATRMYSGSKSPMFSTNCLVGTDFASAVASASPQGV